MIKVKPIRNAALWTTILAVPTILHSCKVDDRYSFDKIQNVDTQVTLFENGLSVPFAQSTSKITVDSILRVSGIDTTAFGKHLTVGENGGYYLTYSDKFTLDEVIDNLDLQNVINIDAVEYSQNVSYKISSVDASSLSTDAKDYSYSDNLQDFTFNVDDFTPTSQNSTIFSQNEVKTAAAAAQKLGLSTVTIPATSLTYTSDDNPTVSGVVLSSHIKSVETIYLKAGAAIKVDVSIPGCIFTSGEITPNIKVDLSDLLTLKDGSTILDCSSLVLSSSNSYKGSATFEVASLNGAKITENKPVKFSGKINCTDMVTSVAAAAAISSDVSVKVEISFVDFALDSAYGQITGFTYNIQEPGETLSYDLPDQIGDFGTFSVIPKGNPTLKVEVDIPEIEGVEITSPEGIKVNVPEFIRFGSFPAAGLVYDEKNSLVTINSIKKATYYLPISKFVITPKKVGSKYVFDGSYSVDGTIGIPDGRHDIAKLLTAAGKNVSVKAAIPAIEAESIKLDELAVDIDEDIDFDLINASDIPEMIKKIGIINLENTKIRFDVSLDNLPDIGDGEYGIEFNVKMPTFVNPSRLYLYGQVVDGKYSSTIDLKQIDLGDIDLDKLRETNGKISGKVNVSGKLKAEDPTVDLSTLSGNITGTVSVKISDDNDCIKVKDLTANVDYQIDSTLAIPFFTLPEELADATFDLPKAALTADVVSNLAIPMSADLDINEGMYTFPVAFPYSADPSESKTQANEFELDLNPLITCGKEEIPATFNLKVSPEKDTRIVPDAEYSMDINLGFSVPLQFGEKFNVTYADTLALEDSAEIIREVLENSPIEFYGKVENTLPFAVDVKLEMLKYDSATDTYTLLHTGADIESIIAQANTTMDFKLLVKPDKGTNLEGLSHIRFSITLGASGALLNKDNYILLKGLGVNVPEGFTVDLADKEDNTDSNE